MLAARARRRALGLLQLAAGAPPMPTPAADLPAVLLQRIGWPAPPWWCPSAGSGRFF
jgi:hypothetical protein